MITKMIDVSKMTVSRTKMTVVWPKRSNNDENVRLFVIKMAEIFDQIDRYQNYRNFDGVS